MIRLNSGPSVHRTRHVTDLAWLANTLTLQARRRVAIERRQLAADERDDVEVLADLTRDCVADAMHGEYLADGEYDYVRESVLDCLRCNGETLECLAAGVVLDESAAVNFC